jgi:HSP20 family protein
MDPFSFSPGEFFANPFGMMRRMHDEMDRLFSESFGSGGSQTGDRPGTAARWAPAIEVSQHGDNMVVSAELPGLRPEDVHLEVTDDALIVSGERRRHQESDEGGIHRTERHYGHFYRAIPLPESVDPEQVHAQFTNGVLEITVPVPQAQSRRRQIPIESGGEHKSGQPAEKAARHKLVAAPPKKQERHTHPQPTVERRARTKGRPAFRERRSS